MSNTIDAGLKREKILDAFVMAFAAALLPLNAFTTDMSAEGLDEGDEVSIRYIPMAAAAQAFQGTYTIQDSDWQKKKVTLDGHNFVSMGLSDKDVMKTPFANLEQQAQLKAFQLAKSVIVDVLGLVTAGNFGAAAFTGAANTFDLDDIADIAGACDDADWPEVGRSLVLSRAYHTAVIKDNVFQDASAAGTTDPLRLGKLPQIHGFQPYKTTVLPANGENLVGFANYPTAIGVGMRYLRPQEGHTYFDARPLVGPGGVVVGFRDWYDPDTGTRKQVFEAIWGKAVIDAAALKRMISSE